MRARRPATSSVRSVRLCDSCPYLHRVLFLSFYGSLFPLFISVFALDLSLIFTRSYSLHCLCSSILYHYFSVSFFSPVSIFSTHSLFLLFFHRLPFSLIHFFPYSSSFPFPLHFVASISLRFLFFSSLHYFSFKGFPLDMFLMFWAFHLSEYLKVHIFLGIQSCGNISPRKC